MSERPTRTQHPLRPPPIILRDSGRGRAGSQFGSGVGEIHSSSYGELFPVTASAVDEVVVEAEEESQLVDSLPSPYMPT